MKRMAIPGVVAGLAVLLFAGADIAAAQWLKIPTPGIPRTPDGKADLNAPAPKTADGKPGYLGNVGPGIWVYREYCKGSEARRSIVSAVGRRSCSSIGGTPKARRIPPVGASPEACRVPMSYRILFAFTRCPA